MESLYGYEVMKLSKSIVWKPQSYLRCLQCCDDLMHEEGRSRVTPRAIIQNASVGNFPYQWKHEYQLSVTGELMYILGAQQKCLDHELKAMSLTKRFDNESSKDDKPEEQHQRSSSVQQSIDDKPCLHYRRSIRALC